MWPKLLPAVSANLNGNTSMTKKSVPGLWRHGFSLIEVLIVVMLITAGILPIYSIIKSGQKRIGRADTRTLATMFGASAIELARTLGFEKSQKLAMQPDFQELADNAKRNGYDLVPSSSRQELKVHAGAKPTFLLRVEITIRSRNRTALSDIPELKFMTILSDPRYNFY
jgi:prepilin-type N-terminal cleavage/methylation domain-containing protein